jgi:hypothetical protein
LKQEEQFNKVISDLVLALEKAGVYDEELRKTIDSLFYLKDLTLLRNELSKPNIKCENCKSYKPFTVSRGTCSQLQDIEVIRLFFCKYHIPLQTNKAPEGSL